MAHRLVDLDYRRALGAARELAFSGQEQIIPLLQAYFDRFDYRSLPA